MKYATSIVACRTMIFAASLCASCAVLRAQDGLIISSDAAGAGVYLRENGVWRDLAPGFGAWGLACDESTCTLYMCKAASPGQGGIWTLAPGQTTPTGPIVRFTADDVFGLSVNVNMTGLARVGNELWGSQPITYIDGPLEGFYSINLSTGYCTLLFLVPSPASNYDFGGIDYDPSTGLLYGVNDNPNNPALAGVYSIDPNNGLLTRLSGWPAFNTFPGSGSASVADVDGLAAGGGKLWCSVDQPGVVKPFNRVTNSWENGFTNPYTAEGINAGAAWGPCFLATAPGCDSIDFNNDGVFPDSGDIADFLSVFSGGPCSTGTCGDIDFNNDGVQPDSSDIEAFLRVFAGGEC